MDNQRLNTENHDRDSAGMLYVYPVISRRAGGVSVGINLNPNHACNWHCAYCQVPDLKRGVAPEIDMEVLRQELSAMLHDILHGDFMVRRVPEDCRQLCDIAISGNGEPTSCKRFDDVVSIIVKVMQSFDLVGYIALRLITNGSYVHQLHVQRGLALMAKYKGEVWIKVDAVTADDIARINGVKASPELLLKQIKAVVKLCPTWVQTCMFAWDSKPPSDKAVAAYLSFLQALKDEYVPIQGVLLYGLARASMQQESVHISALDKDWMQAMQAQIQRLDIAVKLSL